METQKSSELRVRLRRLKSGTEKLRTRMSTSATNASTAGTATVAPNLGPLEQQSSESEDEDFATVHFKLAAALEAAAAHASGLSFDWCKNSNSDEVQESSLGTQAKVLDLPHPSDSKMQGATTPANELHTANCTDTQEDIVADAVEENVQLVITTPQQSSNSSDSDEGTDELVKIMIATPCSSSCSSEDEASATIADTAKQSNLDKFLTAVEANSNISKDLRTYQSSLTEVDSDGGADIGAATCLTNNNADEEDEVVSPTTVVTNILALPPFDPYAPQSKVQLIIKQIVSLAQLKQRIADSSKGAISKNGPLSECERLAEMEFANIHVTHSLEEFFTFCSCKDCLEYREIVVHLMVDQFKAQHMVVMLVDALIKAYSPMLKNGTAYNKFEKLLDANKDIYWMTCGYIYNKMAEHMYFIYDETLSDNMILVLFSAILLVNNPLLLLQILSFQVECVVKAYAEGFLEIVDPENNKIPAEEMLTYILDGYEDLCRISEHISCYLFAFENDFLRKFSLTWTLLCQRLYQQHVYLNLTDTMLACIITLKEDELTARHAALIKKYIQFDDKMIYVDKRWTDVWMELNKFNLTEVERKRRTCLLDVHRIFETVVQDAIELSLRESCDDNDFYDFQTLENRQLAWQNIMAYMKMKWPDGFFEPPNIHVCEDKCKSCNVLLEYHADNCKCITCSIAGGPLPPKRNPDNTCYKCLALLLVDKEVTFYESKILNVCASDDFLQFIKNNEKRKNTSLEELGEGVCSTLSTELNSMDVSDKNLNGTYHLAWAVFRHLNNRKRYKKSSIEEKYFCRECEFQACRLARKILNNEIAYALSLHLIRYYQPLSMSRTELRSILPNIMLYNRKMVSSNIGLDLNDVHDLVVKIYWTFVISVYATYFIEFDKDCPLRLEYFELVNNDIKLQTESLTGNKDDTKFVQFLNKIRSLSCDKDEVESEMDNSDDGNADDIQKKLEEILKINETVQNPPLPENTVSAEQSTPTTSTAVDDSNKKNTKEKSKKCCFDHSDLGDHCKENHSSKKRIKKECNHARMNETRDRLRKKLSQLVNARKNMKASTGEQQQLTKINQPPTLKTAAKAAASNSNLKVEDDDSLECLNTLCKRISHLNTNKPTLTDAAAATTTTAPAKIVRRSQLKPVQNKFLTIEDLAKEKFISNISNSKTAASQERERDKRINASTSNVASSSASTLQNTRDYDAANTIKKTGNGLDMVNEIYELLGTYSKDQSKVKKWINDTLSYIEGSSGNNNNKQQPQPTSAKKAAKKAKQKQRKEEEKRVTELQDLRSQFHDIYFKEFVDKQELKELKANKKRDKKKIAELEANVKKLQRAKAKVETAILELIATVKQTNTEFKFSYLPTKEQQIDKIKQLKSVNSLDNVEAHPEINKYTSNLPTTSAPNESIHQQQQFMISSLQSPNNLNVTTTTNIASGSYSLPYAHANNFPYHIDLQAGVGVGLPGNTPGAAFGMIRPPLPTPICYAPPQHQQLSPDVVAAMAANAACNTSNDPSKRIVTIRRVNLPNVPEPQVTVTAKGSSPDKDKLLYTFVNGQLVQTGTTLPPPTAPITKLPGNKFPSQKETKASSSSLGASSNHLLTLPPPPLSKTQIKKERRRLAQKAAEEAAAIKAERQRLLDEEIELLRQREEEAAAVKKTKRKGKGQNNANEKPKLAADPALPLKLSTPATVSNSKKKKKNQPVDSSASTTSVSTPDVADLTVSTSSATSTQRRSSSVTSCSAAIPSSGTSLSSQVNTRDNSVCSQKPTLQGKSSKGKVLLQNKSNSTQKPQPNKNEKKEKQEQLQPPQSLQTLPRPITPTPIVEAVQIEQLVAVKTKKNKRHKFIDNGQFDNNPFKTLHMTDSTSDSECSCSSGDEDDAEQIIKAVSKNPVAFNAMVTKQLSDSKQNISNVVQQKQITANNQPKNKEQTKKCTGAISEKNDSRRLPHSKTSADSEKELQQFQQRKENEKSERQNVLPTPIKNSQIKQENSQKANKNQPKSHGKTTDAVQRQSQINTKLQNQQLEQLAKDNNSCENVRQIQLKQTTNKRNSNGNARFERSSNNRSNTTVTSISSATSNYAANRNNNRSSNRNSNSSNQSTEQITRNTESTKPLSKRAQKQAQRNKHKSQKQNLYNPLSSNDDCYSGIPNNMGYFNANEFTIPSQQIKQQQKQYQQLKQCQQQQYKAIQQQMQNLHISNNYHQNMGGANNYPISPSEPQLQDISSYASCDSINSAAVANTASNVSIMDQLNRGVQVENLSLPPGITLTKVDPIKSEMLRKKSESIRKLAKPLQQQQQPQTQSFHHPGATIIAPPVASGSSYYGAPYAGVAAAAAFGQSGVIMLEAMPSCDAKPQQQQVPANSNVVAAASNTKSTKSKKRRNKSRLMNNSRNVGTTNAAVPGTDSTGPMNSNGQPKMVTLRNPMFHRGPPGAAAALVQQPNLIQGRSMGGMPLAATLSMDQPAAIIKNENGMFTIRNPALQQAVANGLAMGGYRQFGNVNYYTPQEAVAEAARATRNSTSAKSNINVQQIPTNENSTFSYFSNTSNEQVPQGMMNLGESSGNTDGYTREKHNNISISCTRVGVGSDNVSGLIGDSAVVTRPPQPLKCISAIGSEIKNAQQQKQKSKENQWTNFGQELSTTPNSNDTLSCGASFLSGSGRNAISNSPLQEKYQHSNYYNGFEVFPANSSSSQISSTGGRSSNTGSLFDGADCHMNHNCGDDSPPPKITGFNHYLEGIPNTGVIRYDDASFLKTLMPGQNLNNEVSIHNVNDSNFARGATSPVAHRVDISPVYGNRPTPENIYEHCTTAPPNSSNYRDNISEYGTDTNLFVPNSLLNLNECESAERDVKSFQRYNFDFQAPKEKPKVNVNLNDLLINKSSVSNRTSPFMDENTLDSIVQNINSLQISAHTTGADEQCSELNSDGGGRNGGCKNTPNGWW